MTSVPTRPAPVSPTPAGDGVPARGLGGLRGLKRLRRLADRARLPTQPLLRHLVFFVLGGAFFYFLTTNVSTYNDFQIGEIALYAIVLGGLSLLTGLNGQFSLGHGAFMIIGAYTMALLQLHAHVGIVGELVSATLIAAAAGVIVGIPAARLSAPYLAGVTLMLALALPQLSSQYGSVFGGEQGLTTTPPAGPGSVNSQEWLAWIEIFCALVVLVLLANLARSRFGRAFRAVRDDEIAAAISGIHVARTKVLAFAVSAGCAGLGGALLAFSTGVVNNGEFPLSLSIALLAAMVIGGAGSFVGVWWGAVALVYMSTWSGSLSHQFSLGTSAAAYLSDAIFGVVLIVAILAAPTGIQGGIRWITRRAWRGLVGTPLQTGATTALVAPAAASSTQTAESLDHRVRALESPPADDGCPTARGAPVGGGAPFGGGDPTGGGAPVGGALDDASNVRPDPEHEERSTP